MHKGYYPAIRSRRDNMKRDGRVCTAPCSAYTSNQPAIRFVRLDETSRPTPYRTCISRIRHLFSRNPPARDNKPRRLTPYRSLCISARTPAENCSPAIRFVRAICLTAVRRIQQQVMVRIQPETISPPVSPVPAPFSPIPIPTKRISYRSSAVAQVLGLG